MSVSALPTAGQEFVMKGPPSSEIDDLSNKLALTNLHDVNGNAFDLDTEDKDSAFSSDGGPEYDLADNIDILFHSAGDHDGTLLDEFGAGCKRSLTKSRQDQETNGVPAKRTHQPPGREIRPPPVITGSRITGSKRTGVHHTQISPRNTDMIYGAQMMSNYFGQYVESVQNSHSFNGGVMNKGNNMSPAAVHSPGSTSHKQQAVQQHTVTTPTPRWGQYPASEADLPFEVTTDGESKTEKNQKIQEIMIDLMSSSQSHGSQSKALAMGPPASLSGESVFDFMHGSSLNSGQKPIQAAGPPVYRQPSVSRPSQQTSSQVTSPCLENSGSFHAVGPPPVTSSMLSGMTNLPTVAVGPPNMVQLRSPHGDHDAGIQDLIPSSAPRTLEGRPVNGVASPGDRYGARDPFPAPEVQPAQTHCISNGMSGGTVTCTDMSPSVPPSPVHPLYRRDSSNSNSSLERRPSFSKELPKAQSVRSPNSSYLNQPQVSPDGYHFPPTPISPDSVSGSSVGGYPSPSSGVSQDGSYMIEGGRSPRDTFLHGQPLSVSSGIQAVTSPGGMQTSPRRVSVAVPQSPAVPGQGSGSPMFSGQSSGSPGVSGQGSMSPGVYGQSSGSPEVYGQSSGSGSPMFSGQESGSPMVYGQSSGSPVLPGQSSGSGSPMFSGQASGSPMVSGQSSMIGSPNFSGQSSGSPLLPGQSSGSGSPTFSGQTSGSLMFPGQNPASPTFRRQSSRQVEITQPVPNNFLIMREDNSPCAMPGSCSGRQEEGQTEERDEVEEILSYNEVSQEVVDIVCDSSGVWLEEKEGEEDTFLHSLSGIQNERVAVEYLHHLQHKPNFLRVLNKHNRSSETPLYNAVCLGKAELAAAMIQCGADVNLQCRYETQAHTPLHKAVEKGDAAMVQALLTSHCINVNAERFSDKCTALMVALMKHVPHHPREDRLDIIRLLREEEDIDFKAKDQRSGKTALMMAVETKDLRVVNLLLDELDVDETRQLINAQNRAGNTAVHLAAGLQDCRPLMVKEQILWKLIKLGGDTTKKNNEGDTPKDWARGLIDKVAKFK